MTMDVKLKRLSQRRYSEEVRQRAVRMVFQLREETGERHGSVKRVAEQLDVGVESLRSWVKQAEIDRGDRGGTTSEDAVRIKALEQENRELRRANAILRSRGCRTDSRRLGERARPDGRGQVVGFRCGLSRRRAVAARA